MIQVAGNNTESQLSVDSNAKTQFGRDCVCPPASTKIDIKNLTSISLYQSHLVWSTNDGKNFGVGYNGGCPIIGSLPHFVIREATNFKINDRKGKSYQVISVVCGSKYTLYLLKNAISKNNKLAFVYSHRNSGKPIFPDIENKNPLALFGGYSNAACIDEDGSIIIISQETFESAESDPQILSLPENEKASSVACCDVCLFALSQTGRLFQTVKKTNSFSAFEEVDEFHGIKIAQISGTFEHCIAISNDGKVFVRGSNQFGELGLGKGVHLAGDFIEIESLRTQSIVAGYAGYQYSIFQTSSGKLLSCGTNEYGELLTNKPSDGVYVPSETVIKSGAKFVIAGCNTTVIFVDCDPPPNCPNRPLKLAAKPSHPKTSSAPPKADKELDHMMTENANLKKALEDAYEQLAEAQTKLDEITEENELIKQENEAIKHENESLKRKLRKNQRELRHSRSLDIPPLLNYKEIEILDSKARSKLHEIKELGKGATSRVVKVAREEYFALKIFNNANLSIQSSGSLSKISSSNSSFNEEPERDLIESDDSCDSIHDKHDIDFSAMRHFMQEYEILNNLNHPNIIRVFGFDFGDNIRPPAILLEFFPQTLATCIRKITPGTRARILVEIAYAMKYVHSEGLIHRDLKPENIMVDKKGHIHISDFGISKLIGNDPEESLTSGVGTIRFMAPELLNGKTHYDHKVDVYAFGVIFYFVVTRGSYPDINIVDVGNGKKAEIPESVNQVSRDIINRCWSFNPDERPTFAEILDIIKQNDFKLIEGVDKYLPALRKELTYF